MAKIVNVLGIKIDQNILYVIAGVLAILVVYNLFHLSEGFNNNRKIFSYEPAWNNWNEQSDIPKYGVQPNDGPIEQPPAAQHTSTPTQQYSEVIGIDESSHHAEYIPDDTFSSCN